MAQRVFISKWVLHRLPPPLSLPALLPDFLSYLFSWVQDTLRLLRGFFSWVRDKLAGCITGKQGYQSTPDSGSTDGVDLQDQPTVTGEATDEKQETAPVGSSWSRPYLSRRHLQTYLKREQEDAERSLERKMNKKFEALEVAREDDLARLFERNDALESKVDTIKTEMNEKLDQIMELVAAVPTSQQPAPAKKATHSQAIKQPDETAAPTQAARPPPEETGSIGLERSQTLLPKASPRGSKMSLSRGKSSKASFS